MKFYSFEERLNFLKELQADTSRKFGENGYNVFVFGSVLRDDYKPEESDIDLAVYSDDTFLTFEIAEYLKEYLSERDIESSILEIFLDQINAFVYLEPLRINVTFTDYYPQKLQEFYYCLKLRYLIYSEEEEYLTRMRKNICVRT